MVYRILCVDGGGIRGVFALQVLKMLQEEIDHNLFDKVDCFAGTSTGALIVASLSQGYEPKDMLHFYTFLGRLAFAKNPKFSEGSAKYSNQNLQKMMNRFLPEDPLLSELKPHIIIPTCHLGCEKSGFWQTMIYDNYDREESKKHKLIDIALRSSAAPLYFPSYQKHVDGGLFALNPSLVALARSLDKEGGKKELDEIRLLSIGNGVSPVGINQDIDWGVNKWFSPYHDLAEYPLFSLLTDMGSSIPEYPLSQILREKTLRINGPLQIPIELDDVSKVDVLKKSALDIKQHTPEKWESYKHWVRQNFII